MRNKLRNTGLISAIIFAGALAPFSAQAEDAAATPVPSSTASTATPVVPTTPAAATTSEVSPYQLNILYTGEEWDNAKGGIAPGTSYMNNIDVGLFIDTEKAFGWTGGNFHLEGFYANSNSLNLQHMGSIDVSSAIDTTGPTMFRLYQVFYDQNFAKTGTDVLFGIEDLATEFSTTKPEQLFVNKNFYWNTVLDQSGEMPENGVIGPGDYPYTPIALRVRQSINEQWSVQGAISDGAGDDAAHYQNNDPQFSKKLGVMGIGEVDYEPTKTTKLMAGFWYLTSYTPAYNQITSDGSQKYVYGEEGGYIGGATRLYTQEGKRGLDGFFTLGISDPVTTNTDQSFNTGLTYTGLFDARPHDKMGIAFEENRDPAPYAKSLIAGGSPAYPTEETFEATYRAPIIQDWLTVQPDIQYVIHPGYALKNDVVFGVHFELGHLFNL